MDICGSLTETDIVYNYVLSGNMALVIQWKNIMIKPIELVLDDKSYSQADSGFKLMYHAQLYVVVHMND